MKNLRIFVQMTGANLRGLMSFKVDFLVSFCRAPIPDNRAVVFGCAFPKYFGSSRMDGF